MIRDNTAARYSGMVAAGLVAVAAALAVGGTDLPVLAGVRAVPAAGLWSRAFRVPGLAALAAGGGAGVSLVSCPSAGNCTVAGEYGLSSRRSHGFVDSERHGRWSKAIAIPHLRALGSAQVFSLSCASAGDCAVGGGYKDRSGGLQGFVASERNGRWGKAIEVPGLSELNAGGIAFVSSLSCASAGNCAATGGYADGSPGGGGLVPGVQGFVASERHGVWGRAIEIPGLQALNVGGGAEGVSVSCASAGNCAVGGEYLDGGEGQKGFVASERNGRWGKAIEVPGLAVLDVDVGDDLVSSISCVSAGNCTAGGFYSDRSTGEQGFVASERNGRWGKAIEVPGLGALNADPGGDAQISAVWCASAGNCAAAGDYGDGPHQQGFVVSQRHGRWGKAIEVPGLGALNAGGIAEVRSVSCASAGDCAAAGDYLDRSHHEQGFVVSQRHGRWDKAIEEPDPRVLNGGEGALVLAVSCAPASYCTAGGFYRGRSGLGHGFVVSQRHHP